MQVAEEKSFSLRSKNKTKQLRKPWMTGGILESMRDRDILFSKQLGKNDEQKTRKYQQKRNQVVRICEKARVHYLKNSFTHVVDNPKKTWSLINSKILNKKRTKNTLPTELIID